MAFDPERPNTSETCATNVFATAADGTRDDEPERWTARISETFVPLHARPLDTMPFYGELRTLQRGPLLVACIKGSAQEVRHGHREIAAQEKPAVYLNLQLHGMGQVRNQNAEMLTTIGSGTVVPSDEPFTLRFKESFCQLCVAMPADWLADRLGFPATTLRRRRIDTERGIGRVVRAAIDAVVEAADPEESMLCGELFGQTLAMAVRGPASGSDFSDNRPDVLLSAIGSLIRRRLGEIDLTPAKAAAALGCSPSTLHLHCQRGGRSFMAMLREARLDAAATSLRFTPPGYGRIEAVAFACGFADPSHFARCFKARFGVPPSLYRGGNR